MFRELKERADEFVEEHQQDPHAFLLELPLNGDAVPDGHPTFYTITEYGDTPGMANRRTMMHYLQASVDCGVMFYLTGNESYAKVAADVLGVFASAIAPMELSDSSFNGGIIYPNNHLKEARIFGAQIPLIYDFIATYLEQNQSVHDVVSGETCAFPTTRSFPSATVPATSLPPMSQWDGLTALPA